MQHALSETDFSSPDQVCDERVVGLDVCWLSLVAVSLKPEKYRIKKHLLLNVRDGGTTIFTPPSYEANFSIEQRTTAHCLNVLFSDEWGFPISDIPPQHHPYTPRLIDNIK